ncbi:hypothetical protein [Lysinibacillus pakistanensis]|uniref:DUF4179 domain-containing protein n=1 Tax=Lysinibacillus pakistanensis TaxID=759811 RepID=A0AAX3WRL6_9BACI|nr:hypothetical protein [Lysinibacillus pakistanensis]MDM5233739.1 hypothetical protein [Lysinibacillus pakistanensis]WHY44362.1 hypothetical protein QNH22_13560 [Lysinibacillus pakistanensis]WHY49369.1 hypothetical protein QNH24_13540 [Lysinibacillus pakistanensis]
MEMNLRNRLKATIPDQLALTPQKKEEILEAAHVRFEQQQTPVKKHVWKPVAVGFSALALTALLSYPFIDEIKEQLMISQISEQSYEEVSIPGRSANTLSTAVFDDATNSFYYYEGNTIYSYALDTHIEKAEVTSEFPISEMLVNEDWLAWMADDRNSVFVKNRETLEVKGFSTETFMGLEDDTLLTEMSDTRTGHTIYSLTNLRTNEVKQFKQAFDNSAVSQPIYQDNQLLLPRAFKKDGVETVSFTLYDVGTEKEKQYDLPLKGIHDVALTDHKIYASFRTEDSLETGYVDLVDGSYHKLDGKKALTLTAYQNNLAIYEWIPKEEHYRFRLYQVEEDGSLTPLYAFKDVSLALLIPRYTKEGTLQVFGLNEKYLTEDGIHEAKDDAIKIFLQRYY